ncbi:MAG: hypothetical protein AAB426_14230 [Myxococcota bacterium]
MSYSLLLALERAHTWLGSYAAWLAGHRRLVAAALATLLVLQIVSFLRLPKLELPSGDPRWLELTFDQPRCDAKWWIERGRQGDRPWARHLDDEGGERRCVSAPLAMADSTYLLLQYAGNPQDEDVRVLLQADDKGNPTGTALTLGNPARFSWLLSVVSIPPALRGKTVRLVIEDSSPKRFGWVAIRRLGTAAGIGGHGAGLAPLLRPQVVIASVLLILFCYVALVELGSGVAALSLALATAWLALRFRTFYHWDDYSLLTRFVDAVSWRDLVTYNLHFEPGFLSLYAAATTLARDAYHWLQLAMMLGHVLVVVLLFRLLRRHGFAPHLAALFTVLFAANRAHVDVITWFMESSFLLSTMLVLIAIERSAALVAGDAKGIRGAIVASIIAMFTFSAGLLVPWLAALYLVVFGERKHRQAAWLAGVGLVGGVVVVAVARPWVALAAGGDAGGMHIAQVLWFWTRGVVQGGLLGLTGFGRNWQAGLVALAGLGVFLAVARRKLAWDAKDGRNLLFGALWLLAAFVLQALTRSGLGSDAAIGSRYTYHGMAAAAFLLTAVAQIAQRSLSHWRVRWRRVLAASVAVFLVAVLADDAVRFLDRADQALREFYELNRQQYVLTRAEVARGGNSPTLLDGAFHHTLHPTISRRDYTRIVEHLAGVQAPHDAAWVRPEEAGRQASGWLPVLVE